MAVNPPREPQPAGPAVATDVQDCRAHELTDYAVQPSDYGFGREIAVIGASLSQVKASPSDRESEGCGPHSALFDLAATWGAGGLLVALDRLAAEHGTLPEQAEALRLALGPFTSGYAPTGSAGSSAAWRSTPCGLCAAELGGPRRG